MDFLLNGTGGVKLLLIAKENGEFWDLPLVYALITITPSQGTPLTTIMRRISMYNKSFLIVSI